MNRRVLMAGMAALAGTGTVTAQEATPDDGTKVPVAEDALWFLLRNVIRDGEYGEITDRVDHTALDANKVIEDLVTIHDHAEHDTTVWMLTSDEEQAMAYATVEDTIGTVYNLFLFLTVDADSGLIQSYRWAMGRYSS